MSPLLQHAKSSKTGVCIGCRTRLQDKPLLIGQREILMEISQFAPWCMHQQFAGVTMVVIQSNATLDSVDHLTVRGGGMVVGTTLDQPKCNVPVRRQMQDDQGARR